MPASEHSSRAATLRGPRPAAGLVHEARIGAQLQLAALGCGQGCGSADASDYTIPVHGERRGLHHVGIEVRQDLIADDKGQRAWGPLLARLLAQAYLDLVAAEALRPA
jgi:predicted N-formylglutamate amidohydrolase